MAFSAETRRAALTRMAETSFDLLVIGGGITGCGVALDAASRGLSVALVEKDDFASGTSGRSSRMIHGGVRYVPKAHFGLVRESLRERQVLLRLAPHLVRPVPMYVQAPTLGDAALWKLGLVIYDALATGRNIRRHRVASEDEVRRLAPGIARPTRGLVYMECRTDDARLTLEVARAAHASGALIANHAEVDGLLGDGRVTGARVSDRMTGQRLEVRARCTVNATGVWAERTQAMGTDDTCRLRPSKGVHLVFRPGAIDAQVPVVVPSIEDDGRWVFTVPWGDRTYAGTTDTEYDGAIEHPQVTGDDRRYMVEALGRAFPSLAYGDIVAEWAGLRPLLHSGSGPTEDLSRHHAIHESPPGMLTVTGGKLTTYRLMAQDVVDRAAGALGVRRPSRTASLPLGLHQPVAPTLSEASEEAGRLGLSPHAGRRLVYRYGDDWVQALGVIRDDPSLAEPVAPGLPVMGVEVHMARSREMAITEEDVIVRRTRLAMMDHRAAQEATSQG